MKLDLLSQLVEQKYISVQKHPTANLFIYNYTQLAQYESFWNEYTLICRGLILDGEGNVVARPFPKFFNWEEHQPDTIPKEPFEVYEKMDGSLGILYWIDDEPFIATRGSFVSEQALWATVYLKTHFKGDFSKIDRNCTYLFEIIYPENRIVVHYADRQDLVLLAVIHNVTGQDIPLPNDLSFSMVKKYDGLTDYQSLKNYEAENFEGFVLKFQSGLRVKIKLEEYIRLHRILTRVSNVDIWEWLSENKNFEDFLKDVPDEFYDWVKTTKSALEAEYQDIESQCKANFKDLGDRKTNAAYFLKQPYSTVLFKMLDGQIYDYIIWKLIKPPFQKAFKQ
jgi:RNA ligase